LGVCFCSCCYPYWNITCFLFISVFVSLSPGIELRGNGPWFFIANGFAGEYQFFVVISLDGDCLNFVFIKGPPYERLTDDITICPPAREGIGGVIIDSGGDTISIMIDLKTEEDFTSIGISATNPASGELVPVTLTPL